MATTPVTKQMLFDLVLEIRDQVEALRGLMCETLTEARAINDECRAWRESFPFRAIEKGDFTKSC